MNWHRAQTAYAPPHTALGLVACVAEEVGELSAAVLGCTGEKRRKAHLTPGDVLDAVADAVTYLDLICTMYGGSMADLLPDTFNRVPARTGYDRVI